MTEMPRDMTCAEYIAIALTVLDGEASDADITVVMAHVVACVSCSSEYQVQQQVKYLVHRSGGCSVAPEGLRMRVVASVRQVTVVATDAHDREEQP